VDAFSHSWSKNRQTTCKPLPFPTMWRGAGWSRGKGAWTTRCSSYTGWNPPPGVCPIAVTISSVNADRWPKARWLLLWPPLSSGGKASLGPSGQARMEQGILTSVLSKWEQRAEQFKLGMWFKAGLHGWCVLFRAGPCGLCWVWAGCLGHVV
jgi:hypothetical protein